MCTVYQIGLTWTSEADDDAFAATAKSITDRAIEKAESLGLDSPFLYQNYAASDQDVFAGYGEENRERLLNVSRVYDSTRVFQNYEPGYFKLGD